MSVNDERQTFAAALWAVAEFRVIAEFICCSPVREDHELCKRGDEVLQFLRTLILPDTDAPWSGELTAAALIAHWELRGLA